MNGIDVSKHNGVIDWKKVKDSGQADFAIIKLGNGSKNTPPTCAVDTRFEANLQGALAQGIPCGVYLFSYEMSVQQAKDVANWVIKTLEPYKGKLLLPVYYDMEGEKAPYNQFKLGSKAVSDICDAFCSTIQAAGWLAGIYTNENWRRNRIDPALLKKYELWLAWYRAKKPDGIPDMKIWQKSETGEIAGLSGYFDLNEAYTDYPAKVKGEGWNGFGSRPAPAAPSPAPAPAPVISRPTLRLGAKGDDVKYLQGHLIAKGQMISIDGDFGPLTAAAVRAVQKAANIKVDGEVGPQTWAVLEA